MKKISRMVYEIEHSDQMKLTFLTSGECLVREVNVLHKYQMINFQLPKVSG